MSAAKQEGARAGRGRRPGPSAAREEILAAARASFASRGFSGTTIRAVAAEAGVDAALVHHYFGAKDDLFVASLDIPLDPREVLGAAALGPADSAAERLLRTFFAMWEDPKLQPGLLAMARRVLEPDGARLLQDGFLRVVVMPALAPITPDRAEERIPLVATQILGLITARYVLRVDGLAAEEPERLVARLAPVIQGFLTGPLAGPLE
ncbi:MAG: TetR family transcriptional regulator [Nocardioides sp.]